MQVAGLERTQEILRDLDPGSAALVTVRDIAGRLEFDHVSFRYDGNLEVLRDFPSAPTPEL